MLTGDRGQPAAPHAPASAARILAQLRVPLWNEVRSYFSFGECTRSSSTRTSDAAQGTYIGDEQDRARRRGGPAAAQRTVVHLLESEQLDDQLAGLDYVKHLDYVDPTKLVVAGCSYGGIQTLLGAERVAGLNGYRAAIAISPAAQSWEANGLLRDRLIRAVRNITSPSCSFNPRRMTAWSRAACSEPNSRNAGSLTSGRSTQRQVQRRSNAIVSAAPEACTYGPRMPSPSSTNQCIPEPRCSGPDAGVVLRPLTRVAVTHRVALPEGVAVDATVLDRAYRNGRCSRDRPSGSGWHPSALIDGGAVDRLGPAPGHPDSRCCRPGSPRRAPRPDCGGARSRCTRSCQGLRRQREARCADTDWI